MLSIHICIYYTYQYIIHVNIHILVENGKIEYIQMNHGETNIYIYIYTHNYMYIYIYNFLNPLKKGNQVPLQYSPIRET